MNEELLRTIEYKKYLVVANAALFMDDNLKISEASPYAKQSNNMYKFDDTSTISSREYSEEYADFWEKEELLVNAQLDYIDKLLNNLQG